MLGLHMKRFSLFLVGALALVVGCQSSDSSSGEGTPSNTSARKSDGGDTKSTSAATANFASVQPVFARCTGCHSGPGAKEGIDFSTRESIMKGGHDGPVVVAGDANGSLVIKALKGDGAKQMPPKGKLPDEEVAKVADWIAAGAPE
jgi:hypothetical protein